MIKRLKVLAWALGLLAAAMLVAWWALPSVIRSQIESRGSEALGRAVRVARVEVEPWKLAITLHQLSVAAADAKAPPQLTLARLHADAGLSSLWRLAPVIEALQIDAPRLRLVHVADGRFDIDDLVTRFAPKPGTPPARFALFNIELRDGAIEIDDRPMQARHELREVQLALPFIANLPEQVQVKVQPRVAMSIDGRRIDLRGESRPFAPDLDSDISFSLREQPLARWWPYLSASLPLKPQGGRLTADIKVHFTQREKQVPLLGVSGTLQLRDFALRLPGDAPLAAWQSLAVQLLDVRPLERLVSLGTMTLQGAQIDLRRAADGRLVGLSGSGEAPAAASPAASAAVSPPWSLAVQRVAIEQATVRWSDETTKPAAVLAVQPLNLSLDRVRWPGGEPSPLTLSAELTAGGKPAGRLDVQGQVSPSAAQLTLKASELQLAAAAPYLRALLTPSVDGQLTAQAALRWQAGDKPLVEITEGALDLVKLRVSEGAAATREPSVALASLRAEGVQLNLAERRVSLARLRIEQPSLRLQRDDAGKINVAQWLVAAPDDKPGPDPAPPWRAELKDVLVEGGLLQLDDAAARPGTPPQRTQIRGLRLVLQDLRWPADKTALRWQIAARVAAPRDEGPAAPDGRIDARGQATLAPLAASAALTIERLALHAFEPYFGPTLPYALARAELGWRGDVRAAQGDAGWSVDARGALRVADLQLRARQQPSSDFQAADHDLLNWQLLTAEPLRLVLAPGAKPRVEIDTLALSDFYTQLVITEQGRFNLRDAPAAASPAPAPASPSASAPPADFPVALVIGQTKLNNGRIDFRDRFVRPSYSAALSDLNGSIGRLASDTRDMAPIELRGRVAGTGLLDIRGALNPTANPLALDIAARATDLELAPLSPYSGKYAGYAIERGKLSVDVAYKIDADGKLDARNQLILNQLTLGEKVDSPEATQLPVRLALALLTDRNGVIDINLPVSGSINDPQFSVFGLVLKIIGNLLVKALTAPFSLLAGGGTEELSVVEFEPGTPRLAGASGMVLERVAQLLTDRPALRLTVQGHADATSEAEAMRSAALEARLATEWSRERARAALPAAAASAPGADERLRLLKRLYADTPLPDKPRNALGLVRELPAAEMAVRLQAAVALAADAARELALQRGLAVRDALIARGLPSQRLFLGAPLLRGSAGVAPWTPRVQLTLAGP